MIDSVRNKILDVLIEFDRIGTYPNLSLKKHLRDIDNRRDKNFISALVYGVIEKRITLDYYISKVSNIKINKLNLVVLNILRMGIYQIAYMDIPLSAACNTSVELAKNNGQLKSAGFVNAVLRKLAQGYKDIQFPEKNDSRYYPVKYSISPTVAGRMISSLGKSNFEALMEFERNNSIHIAVNILKTDSEQLIEKLKCENVTALKTDVEGLLLIDGSIDIEHSELFKNGLFHVVGKASYLAARSLDVKENDVVFDMCAAPGGKTFSIYNLSHGTAKITAFDIHKHKINNLVRDCDRLGFSNITPILNDGSTFNNMYEAKADKILCDVPCSGLGMILSKPDIKYKTIDYNSLINTQLSILCNAAKYLRSNGRIVYSTCTVNREENQGVISSFLDFHDDFEIDDTAHIYNDYYGEKLFLPHTDGFDGFYIAVLKKKN